MIPIIGAMIMLGKTPNFPSERYVLQQVLQQRRFPNDSGN